MGTYETPAGAKKRLHYGEIDFEGMKKQEKGEKQMNPNFLSDDSDVSLPTSHDTSLDEAVEALRGKGSSLKRKALKGNDILEASGTYHNDEVDKSNVKGITTCTQLLL